MITRELFYQPKGGMCAVCKRKNDDCGSFDFASMPKICKGDMDGVVIVRCINFDRSESNASSTNM